MRKAKEMLVELVGEHLANRWVDMVKCKTEEDRLEREYNLARSLFYKTETRADELRMDAARIRLEEVKKGYTLAQ